MPSDIRSFFGSGVKAKRKAENIEKGSAKKRKLDDGKPKFASIFNIAKGSSTKKVQEKSSPAKGTESTVEGGKSKVDPSSTTKTAASSTSSKLSTAPKLPEATSKEANASKATDSGPVLEVKKQKPIIASDTHVDTKLSADVLRARYKGDPYDPVKHAGWKKGKPMLYTALAECFNEISNNSKRLDKVRILGNLLRSVILLSPELLLEVLYLSVNQFAPPYAGIELGVGDSVIIKALSDSTGRKAKDIKLEYQKEGDLGLVAVKSRTSQRTMFPPPPLKTKKVFDTFKKIAMTKGNRSTDEKARMMSLLFVSAKGNEATFIVRALQGKMRMGLAEQTVFQALGRALAFTPLLPDCKNKKQIADRSKNNSATQMFEWDTQYTEIIKQVFAEIPNYDLVVAALVKYGIYEVHNHCHLTPGIPIKAMLAKPTTGIQEILKRFCGMKFTLEYKYDGERAQIHLLADGSFKFFSRNAEDNTTKFPDLASTMKDYCKPGVQSFILDSEVVAYDRVRKKILPFQVLTHRKRKDVEEKDVSIQVCVYAFDCLYINGESLIREPFGKRRNRMYESFNATEGKFMFANHRDTDDAEVIQEYLTESIEQSCEGLMVKTLWQDATYEPSRRSHNWLKCKKDYLESGGDSLDLVVIGAFYGTGKRTGKYGSFLAACYDEDEDYYQSICKIGTGFKDEDLKNHFDSLSKNTLPKKPSNYMVTDNFKCDVWFDAAQVWEVKCADLTISPQHQAAVGLVHEYKGIALRFPRFMRLREDKRPTEATSAQQVADMYRSQAQIQNA